MVSRLSALCLPLFLALAVSGCGGSPAATFSAGDLSAVQEALALRGATIVNLVSGDPGCEGSDLHSNAVRVELQLAGEDRQQRAYLIRWRRPAQFEAGRAAFEECVSRAGGLSGADSVDTLEVPPWRAHGRSWTPELLRVLEDSLRATGGG
jgi:hypothetical protein